MIKYAKTQHYLVPVRFAVNKKIDNNIIQYYLKVLDTQLEFVETPDDKKGIVD